jgi:hypothetical protein
MSKHKNIRTLLASSTGSLLGLSTAVEAQQGEGWKTDVAVLVYNEADRVSAFEPVISTKKRLMMNLKWVLNWCWIP